SSLCGPLYIRAPGTSRVDRSRGERRLANRESPDGRVGSRSGKERAVVARGEGQPGTGQVITATAVKGRVAHPFVLVFPCLTILRVPHPWRRARSCFLRSEQRVGLSRTSNPHC